MSPTGPFTGGSGESSTTQSGDAEPTDPEDSVDREGPTGDNDDSESESERVDVSSLQEPPTPNIRMPRPLPAPATTPPTPTEAVDLPPPAPLARSTAPTTASRSTRPASTRLVTERLRHISPLSVLKISAIFYTCAVLVFLVTSVLLWQFARGTGTVDDVEDFITQLFTYGDCVPDEDVQPGQGFRENDQCPEGQVMVGGFEISDVALFQFILFGGLIFVVVGTVGTVFMVLLFNLLSDVTGGVRYTVSREPQGATARASGSTRARGRR